MNINRLLATALVVAMVLSLVAVPGAAIAETGDSDLENEDPDDVSEETDGDDPTDGDETGDDADEGNDLETGDDEDDGSENGAETDLSIDVDQTDGITVTVTDDDDDPVENADVTVSSVEDVPYEETGTTDADGTVDLPEPDEPVRVTIEALTEDGSGDSEETLYPTGLWIDVDQTDGIVVTVTDSGEPVEDAGVTVSTVDETASYVGTGDYTTDDNGDVSLPAPVSDETEVTIEVTVDEETVTTNATLEPDDAQSFGDLVSAFVQELKDDGDSDGPLGLQVAGFVVEYNPGNAPDHAGPPAHAGPPSEDNEKKGNQGPPSHAGGNDKHDDRDKRGSPNHGEDDETDEEETDEEEVEEDADNRNEDESTEDESAEE